jgi:hypothetical protein
MIISKATIAFVLGSAFVASAIVYDGIAHHRHEVAASTNPPAAQTPEIPKPSAGTPLNSDQTGDQDAQSADPSSDPNAQADQNAAADQADANSPDQSDGQADGNDSNPAPVSVVQRRVVVYPSPVVAVHRVIVAHVLHLAPAAPVATTAYVAPAAIASSSALVVPTGTPLILRLSEDLGSSSSQPGQTFSATLERNVNIGGKTIFPSGSLVNGKIVAARPAGALAGEANLQLQVTSLQVDNRQINVQTAVNTFGPTIQGKNKVSRFFKGIGKRLDGDEREVQLDQQTAYTFVLSHPLLVQ